MKVKIFITGIPILLALVLSSCFSGMFKKSTYQKTALTKNDSALLAKEKTYTDALKLNAKDASAYYGRANCRMEMGDHNVGNYATDYHYARAAKDYKKAIKLNPARYNDTAYYMIGVATMHFFSTANRTNGYPSARKKFSKVINVNPKYAAAYFQRGKCLIELGKLKEAIDDLNKVIELDPILAPKAYYYRGNCKYEPRGLNFTDKRDKEGACKDWAKANMLGYYAAQVQIEHFCR